jgi:dolichyl-phosphate beta-glucosyltransferase
VHQSPASRHLPALYAPPQPGAASEPPYLSLVIPAFNEERRLGPTLESVLSYLASRPYRSEVIVVSDGSTDGTARVTRAAFARVAGEPRLSTRFHHYSPNAGKGKAVRTGVLMTRGQFVAFTDADLSTPIEEIERALAYLEGHAAPPDGSASTPAAARQGGRYRIVIGSRAAAGAAIARYQPLYRRLSAKGFNVVRDALVGIHGLRDTQCGLKVFEGEIARAIFGRQRINGFMFDVETLFIAQRLGIPILELGVRWADAPESKVRLSSGLRLIPDLLRIRLLHGRLSPADAPRILAAAPATIAS